MLHGKDKQGPSNVPTAVELDKMKVMGVIKFAEPATIDHPAPLSPRRQESYWCEGRTSPFQETVSKPSTGCVNTNFVLPDVQIPVNTGFIFLQ